MTELERQEKEANIAKLRAETESLKMNVVLNIIKTALAAGTFATAIVGAAKVLMG